MSVSILLSGTAATALVLWQTGLLGEDRRSLLSLSVGLVSTGVLAAAVHRAGWLQGAARAAATLIGQSGAAGQTGADPLFNALPEAVLVLDGPRSILRANAVLLGLTGYAEADVAGAPPETLIAGPHGSACAEEIWRALVGEGAWSGELWVRRKDGQPFMGAASFRPVRGADGTVRQAVGVLHDITARIADQERTWRLANYDPLTGLPNRLLFNDRLAQAVRRGRRDGTRFALLYVDLDGFKAVNDLYGHAAGDRVLQETARRLTAGMRASDTVARLGGDEFVVILPDVSTAGAAVTVAQKILDRVRVPFVSDGIELRLRASVGVAMFPDCGNSAEALVGAADRAMYGAKAGGKDRLALVDGSGRISDVPAAVQHAL